MTTLLNIKEEPQDPLTSSVINFQSLEFNHIKIKQEPELCFIKEEPEEVIVDCHAPSPPVKSNKWVIVDQQPIKINLKKLDEVKKKRKPQRKLEIKYEKTVKVESGALQKTIVYKVPEPKKITRINPLPRVKFLVPQPSKNVFVAPRTTIESPKPIPLINQCPHCQVIYKTHQQLNSHLRFHDKIKGNLATEEMTKNVYEEVKLKVKRVGVNKSLYILMPYCEFAFMKLNSTTSRNYLKCFLQGCDVRAYEDRDGKFFVKKGDEHSHGGCPSEIARRVMNWKKNEQMIDEKLKKNAEKLNFIENLKRIKKNY